jgi:hypothetical protein
MGAVLRVTHARRGIIVTRRHLRSNRYLNSASYRGTCFEGTALYVPTKADLMLPRTVLTHMKDGFLAACAPPPVCENPYGLLWIDGVLALKNANTVQRFLC